MKYYDYKKAKKIVEEEKNEIQEAVLGMEEDWFWTAETIFENGEYKKDLDDQCLCLGGINGSSWATPTLEILYKDDRYKKIVCYKED